MMRIRYYHSLPFPDMWKGGGDHCPVVLAVSPSQPQGRWVVVKGKLLCQWLVASSFRILRSLFSNSTVKVASGILPLQPLPQFLSTQSPAISPFSLKIFSVLLLLSFCFLQLILVNTRVLYFSSLGLTWKPGKKWERKSQSMSCHQSFIHKCIHYMTHSHKYLSNICYMPGTVGLTNSFDLLRSQGGDGSKRENWEHPLMLNPLAKTPVVYQVWKLW